MTAPPDPLGKRALFEAPPAEAEDLLRSDPLVGGDKPEGRAALYSSGPRRPGTSVLECSHCGTRSRMSTIEAMVRVLAVSAWIPGLRYNRWVQCPQCIRRTWSRIDWCS